PDGRVLDVSPHHARRAMSAPPHDASLIRTAFGRGGAHAAPQRVPADIGDVDADPLAGTLENARHRMRGGRLRSYLLIEEAGEQRSTGDAARLQPTPQRTHGAHGRLAAVG